MLRDSRANWIMGYFGKLGCNSSMELELWAGYLIIEG